LISSADSALTSSAMSTVRLDLVDLHHKFLAQLENNLSLNKHGKQLDVSKYRSRQQLAYRVL